MTIKYEIYIGLNDKDEFIQVISDNTIMNILTKTFEEATIIKSTGVYHTMKEPYIKVELIEEARDRIDIIEKIKSLKVRLNQECILMTETVLSDVRLI